MTEEEVVAYARKHSFLHNILEYFWDNFDPGRKLIFQSDIVKYIEDKIDNGELYWKAFTSSKFAYSTTLSWLDTLKYGCATAIENEDCSIIWDITSEERLKERIAISIRCSKYDMEKLR